jgi:hypothetical protein
MIRSQSPVRTAVASADGLGSDADRSHQPGLLGLGERRHAGRDAVLEVVLVGIVQVGDVDPLGAEAFEALPQGPAHSRRARVPPAAVHGGHHETLVIESVGGLRARFQQSSDLGGQQVV